MKVIGEYLREIVPGLKENDIIRALREQAARADRGEHIPIGEILLGWGLIAQQDLRLALERQATEGKRLFVPRYHGGHESMHY